MDKLEKTEMRFCITHITLCELFKGIYESNKINDSLRLIDEFLLSVDILEFTDESCRLFGEKYVELKKKGRPTGEADLMIGCIALSYGVTIATRNGKDFTKISGLNVLEV